MNKLWGTIIFCVAVAYAPRAVVFAQPQATRTQQQTQRSPEAEQEQIRTVLRDCQFEETLDVYGNPKDFDESILTRCFVPETKGGKAVVQVENSVQRLLEKGWHYSTKKSANEEFVFLEVKIFPQGNVAEVRTRERWYLLMVDEQDHIVIEREPRMEYEVTYRLVKMDGKWLIQSNSTPRPRQ